MGANSKRHKEPRDVIYSMRTYSENGHRIATFLFAFDYINRCENSVYVKNQFGDTVGFDYVILLEKDTLYSGSFHSEKDKVLEYHNVFNNCDMQVNSKHLKVSVKNLQIEDEK